MTKFIKGYTPWNKGKTKAEFPQLSHSGGFKKGHRPWITGTTHSLATRIKMKLNHSNKRWEGHICKYPRKKDSISHSHFRDPYSKDPLVQLNKKRFRNRRYKIHKRNATGNHTFHQWQDLKKKYNYMCLCCKQFEPIIKLTEDHIIPLSMGGSNNIDNIQPLCSSCNTRKSTQDISYLPIIDSFLTVN